MKLNKNVLLFSLCPIFGALTPASAASVFFSGTTTGGPTWNRPSGMTTLHLAATAVPYEVIPFFVTLTGAYQADLHGITLGDPHFLVYGPTFNAATPLVGLINGDDDYNSAAPGPLADFAITPGGVDSAIRVATGVDNFVDGGGLPLTANTQYFLVATGYNNDYFGTYQGAIGNGPAVPVLGLVAVPEPSYALFSAFGGLGLLLHRRRS